MSGSQMSNDVSGAGCATLPDGDDQGQTAQTRPDNPNQGGPELDAFEDGCAVDIDLNQFAQSTTEEYETAEYVCSTIKELQHMKRPHDLESSQNISFANIRSSNPESDSEEYSSDEPLELVTNAGMCMPPPNWTPPPPYPPQPIQRRLPCDTGPPSGWKPSKAWLRHLSRHSTPEAQSSSHQSAGSHAAEPVAGPSGYKAPKPVAGQSKQVNRPAVSLAQEQEDLMTAPADSQTSEPQGRQRVPRFYRQLYTPPPMRQRADVQKYENSSHEQHIGMEHDVDLMTPPPAPAPRTKVAKIELSDLLKYGPHTRSPYTHQPAYSPPETQEEDVSQSQPMVTSPRSPPTAPLETAPTMLPPPQPSLTPHTPAVSIAPLLPASPLTPQSPLLLQSPLPLQSPLFLQSPLLTPLAPPVTPREPSPPCIPRPMVTSPRSPPTAPLETAPTMLPPPQPSLTPHTPAVSIAPLLSASPLTPQSPLLLQSPLPLQSSLFLQSPLLTPLAPPVTPREPPPLPPMTWSEPSPLPRVTRREQSLLPPPLSQFVTSMVPQPMGLAPSQLAPPTRLVTSLLPSPTWLAPTSLQWLPLGQANETYGMQVIYVDPSGNLVATPEHQRRLLLSRGRGRDEQSEQEIGKSIYDLNTISLKSDKFPRGHGRPA